MTYKRFIIKIARRIIWFACLMILVSTVAQSVSPIVSNEMALGQMQNSNEAYILMNTYNKVRPIITAVYSGIIIWFTSTIARDIYKFVKTKNTKNEKEN